MKLRMSQEPFRLSSGGQSFYRLEADTSQEDPETLEAMASIIAANVPPFDEVVGVPRGGLALAAALGIYCIPGADCVLFVDDVWTTGGSLDAEVAKRLNSPKQFAKAVVWDRGGAPDDVFCLFKVNGLKKADRADVEHLRDLILTREIARLVPPAVKNISRRVPYDLDDIGRMIFAVYGSAVDWGFRREGNTVVAHLRPLSNVATSYAKGESLAEALGRAFVVALRSGPVFPPSE